MRVWTKIGAAAAVVAIALLYTIGSKDVKRNTIPQLPPPPVLSEEEMKALDQEFQPLIAADGDEYLRLRNAFVLHGAWTRGFLMDKVKTARTWQEQTLAWILLERIENADAISHLLVWQQPVNIDERHRGTIDRARSKAAAAFRNTPMVLVESLWKTNELHWRWSGFGYYEEECVLGWIGDKRAVDVLIMLLEGKDPLPSLWRENLGRVRAGAAKALGMVRDPKAVPALLEGSLDPNAGVQIESTNALEDCIDRASIPIVEHFIQQMTVPEGADPAKAYEIRRDRQFYEELLKKRKAEFEAQDERMGS